MEAHTCTFRQTHSAPSSAWQPSNQVADSQHFDHFVPEFNSSDFSAKVSAAAVRRIFRVYNKGQKVGPVVVFHLFAQPGVSLARQVVDHRPAVCSRPGFYSYEDCQLSSKQLQTVKQALLLKNSLSF